LTPSFSIRVQYFGMEERERQALEVSLDAVS
jgi:hypothetical protein